MLFLRFLRFPLGALVVLIAITGTPAQNDKDKDRKPPEVPGINDDTRPGEDYRRFFKQPKTVPDFWAAMQFEIDIGKFDLAAALLRGLLVLKPTDEELVKIHEKDGMIAFLKLRFIKPWIQVPPFNEARYQARIEQMKKDMEPEDKIGQFRVQMNKEKEDHQNAMVVNQQAEKDVEELIKLATAAVKKHLSDPVRINKYIQHLKASPEEREYALKQLYPSGARVVPHLVAELKNAKAEDRVAILDALTRLSSDLVPPLLATLDSDNRELLSDMIDVLVKRKAIEAVPRLWFLSASTTYPADIRRKAAGALSQFLNQPVSRLPPARTALLREAERYYQHKVEFADPKAVILWRWDGNTVMPTVVPATKAEEYYAVKYTNQALQLDPSYQQAQIVLLSTVLDKTYEQTGLALPLAKSAPQVHELLATSNPELLNLVLERALNDRRTPVILGAIRALGALADVRSSRPTASGAPALVRALNYPDRRVHFAAAEALLNVPGSASTQQTTRIVEVLRRSLAAEPAAAGKPRVLVAYFNPDLANRVADAVATAGYDPVRVNTGRELMKRVNESADIDLILMDEALPDPGLATLLGQLRADRNAGLIPILLTAGTDREEKVRRWAEQFRNVTVLPTGFVSNPDDLKVALEKRIVDPGAPPLSEGEMKEYAEKSVYYLARLSLGEPAGFDIRPAAQVVADALRSGKLSPGGRMAAVDLLGRVPGERAQAELANVILDVRNPSPVRQSATASLIRHLQKHSPTLTKEVIANLEALQIRPDTDPDLRANLALVMGALRPNPRLAGERLLQFQPNIPQAQPLPPLPKD